MRRALILLATIVALGWVLWTWRAELVARDDGRTAEDRCYDSSGIWDSHNEECFDDAHALRALDVYHRRDGPPAK